MDPLFKLNTCLTNPDLSGQQKLEMVCATVHKLIPGADRVSLWLFNESKSQVSSLICFDATSKSWCDQITLRREDFGIYFDAILNREFVDAPDAATHPDTKCFNESYFTPLNIQSLLDYILHRNFEPQGILCCESVGRQVHWSEEDKQTLKKIARSCSFFFNLSTN
ncbi:GAF domain-containing protein [Planctobacterium marinum]|uniref:GAF domain-containing protein n=1 Tax=Planctobacterium marinum TaxID=1631968 RepID=A0AA48KQY3_9ALTE|nr:hypothetical protein MACH26_04150 [Planctobacterium marinum]